MNELRERSILVTGGAGFIGSHLVEELVGRGANVTVADDLSTGRPENLESVAKRFTLETLDLSRDDLRPLLSAQTFEIIFHLAGNANVLFSVENPGIDFERNALSTFRLLEEVRRTSPRSALLHVSSAAVYGEARDRPLREEDPTAPVSPYGLSKLAAERYVALYSRLYGLRAAVLRFFPVYGPRQRQQVVYDFLSKLRMNPQELHIHGDGEQLRDFTHVSSAVAALLLVARKGALSGETYNVAAEEPVSIRQVAEAICHTLGVTPRFVFSGEKRPGDAQRWVADTTRIRNLGYRPTLPLSEGLAGTAAWFKTLH